MCRFRLTASLIAVSALVMLFLRPSPSDAYRPWARNNTSQFWESKNYEGSSNLINLQYHMGPVLTSNITIHLIWYGTWKNIQKRIIRNFIASISDLHGSKPSTFHWWSTLSQYTDQTGNNISRTVLLGSQKSDRFYSHGKTLSRLTVQHVIKDAVTATTRPLKIQQEGIYLLLTSDDVYVQDFCRNVCGFHYFTFPSIVGYTLPYAWVGNSKTQCPGSCAYPFAVPDYIPNTKPLKSPNGDVGVEGMITVIGHELAELASNPLVNAWYAGDNPTSPVEVADLCEGIYGTGGGGSYTGQMLTDVNGATYNVNGNGRKFLLQWLWSDRVRNCYGPNAIDQ